MADSSSSSSQPSLPRFTLQRSPSSVAALASRGSMGPSRPRTRSSSTPSGGDHAWKVATEMPAALEGPGPRRVIAGR
ncbi:MAG: hypothetical protein IPN17_26580 [Deltaproteobacteria bacterium]|nr:hypothetical protein [Deltaproteobacteria bacterium]MBK8695741.1 hypothetical protein [Deltaproteobacteria bacterium]